MAAGSGPGPDPDLPRRLGAHLDRTGLIPPGTPLLVALSGGLDSVALLHLLRFHLAERVGPVRAAHLDHAMRPGSAADADWARGLCRAWDVPLQDGRLDPPATGEADARERRYAFLEAAAGRGALVVTAHHLDDQAETVLLRAARGTGVRGLRGIAPRRGGIVRPLLEFDRAEIEAYAREVSLRWRDDPTNRSLSLARNRVRHVVIPALERARPGATRSLARLADRARAAEAALEAATKPLARTATVERRTGEAVLARDVLRSYHPHLRARVLRRVLRRYGCTPDRTGTRAALEFISSGPSGGELHLPGGVRLERDFERIRVVRGPDPAFPDRPLRITGPGPGQGQAVVGGRTVEVGWGPGGHADGPPGASERARIRNPRFPLVIRSWRPGDRVRLGYGSKKLKKLFSERRLDRRERKRTPVLEDATGRILWVVGLAHAEESGGEEEMVLEIAVADAR